MDNLNFNYESDDSNDKGPSKEDLIKIFVENEETIFDGLEQLDFRLKIGDYELVLSLLHSMAEVFRSTQTLVGIYLTSKEEDDDDEGDDDDPIDDLLDLSRRLN